MENNKEVKNIADHQEQHHAEAPPPQEYLGKQADNPLQPPQPQQLPGGGAMEGDGGENKERPKTKEDDDRDTERYCCWCSWCFRRVVMENHDECCCTDLCVLMRLCMTWVFCFCRNGCRDSLYP